MPLRRPFALMAALLSFVLLFNLLSFSPARGDDNDQPPPPPQVTTQPTGEYVAYFTEPSPLSDRKKLAERLNLTEAQLGPPYKLTDANYQVYVPAEGPPPEGFGIFYYTRYHGVHGPLTALYPLMNQKHLILITLPQPESESDAVNTGLALDAVYNLKQRYKINDKRVYRIGNLKILNTALATADVFDGAICLEDMDWDRRFVAPHNRYFDPDPDAHRPSAAMFEMAKNRAYVFSLMPEDYTEEYRSAFLAMLSQNGFVHFGMFKTDESNTHVFATDVMTQLIDMLESLSVAKTSPPIAATQVSPPLAAVSQAATTEISGIGSTTEPALSIGSSNSTASKPKTVQPAANPAVTELGLAQTLIANGRSDLAKDKLQEIIQKYPTDPAAAQAQTLLDQLNAQ